MAWSKWNEGTTLTKEGGAVFALTHEEFYVKLKNSQTVEEALAEIDTTHSAMGSLAFVSGHGVYSWDGEAWNSESGSSEEE